MGNPFKNFEHPFCPDAAWYAFPGENGLKITDVIKDRLQTVVSKASQPETALVDMSKAVQALLPRQ